MSGLGDFFFDFFFDLGLATIKGAARLAGPDIQVKKPGPECE